MMDKVDIEILADGYSPSEDVRHIWDDNLADWIKAHDNKRDFIPPIQLAKLPDVELRSDFMGYFEGEPVVLDLRYYPDYVAPYMEKGLAEFGFKFHDAVHEVRFVDEPVMVVSHFNMATYGHFLMEVLPKILLSALMWHSGRKTRIAFPMYGAYSSSMVREIVPPEMLLFYNSEAEILKTPLGIFPSLCISPDYDPHPFFVGLVRSLTIASIVKQGRQSAFGSRIFLSRTKHFSKRRLANEDELFEIAARHGFVRMHPQELSWEEQIVAFSGVSHLIGEYTSALHNNIFAPPGARIFSLGRVNAIVARVAAALGQSVGYELASQSQTIFDPKHNTEVQEFVLDKQAFEARLLKFVDA